MIKVLMVFSFNYGCLLLEGNRIAPTWLAHGFQRRDGAHRGGISAVDCHALAMSRKAVDHARDRAGYGELSVAGVLELGRRRRPVTRRPAASGGNRGGMVRGATTTAT